MLRFHINTWLSKLDLQDLRKTATTRIAYIYKQSSALGRCKRLETGILRILFNSFSIYSPTYPLGTSLLTSVPVLKQTKYSEPLVLLFFFFKGNEDDTVGFLCPNVAYLDYLFERNPINCLMFVYMIFLHSVIWLRCNLELCKTYQIEFLQ